MGAESGLRRRVKGLSEAEFRQRFGTEAQCRAALYQLRWGKGWACPACGHGRCAELKGRALYQCNRCKHQVGLTAGTVFHWTKLPLTTWFLAIYHLTQSKGGMSLGRARPPARHPPADRLAAQAQADGGDGRRARRKSPSSQGGSRSTTPISAVQRSGGKRGRGAAGKTPFVAAVETTAERKPRRLRLTVVKGFRKKEIAALAKRDFAAGSNVVTDGLSCWTAVTAGRLHPLPDGHRRRAAGRQAGFPSPGSTPRSATSRRRSPAPTITSAPSTPSATLPASPGVSTAATSWTP